MDPIALSVAILSLIASSVAIVVAFRAAEKAAQANRRSEVVASGAAANAFASQPSREERVAWARGHIEAAKGAELISKLYPETAKLPAFGRLALAADRDRLSAQVEGLTRERERALQCHGDVPCGACITCLNGKLDSALADLAATREKLTHEREQWGRAQELHAADYHRMATALGCHVHDDFPEKIEALKADLAAERDRTETQRLIAEEAIKAKADADAHWKNAFDEVSADLAAERAKLANAVGVLEVNKRAWRGLEKMPYETKPESEAALRALGKRQADRIDAMLAEIEG